jgi:ferredoxin-NADP reductase
VSTSTVKTELAEGQRLLRVVHAEDLPGRVRNVRLEPADGKPIGSFAPGSNIGVQWDDNLANSYSLVGENTDPEFYEISVLAQPEGRGGSLWVHRLEVGDTVVSTGVRSAFPPIAKASHHLLVAAGIGITPVLSHARWHAHWGHSFTVLYVHRPGEGAHLDELRELCGDGLQLYPDRKQFWAEFPGILADQPFGTHLYTCGPLSMIDDVARVAGEAYWPEARVHSEAFSSAALDPGRPFNAVLKRTGRTVSVPSGASLLEAVEKEGIRLPSLCRQGFCGECRVSVLSGAIEHRDIFLSTEEKESGQMMMACVSRAAGTEVEIDL